MANSRHLTEPLNQIDKSKLEARIKQTKQQQTPSEGYKMQVIALKLWENKKILWNKIPCCILKTKLRQHILNRYITLLHNP